MFGYTRAADESLGSDTVDRVDSLGCQVGILLDVKYSCPGDVSGSGSMRMRVGHSFLSLMYEHWI